MRRYHTHTPHTATKELYADGSDMRTNSVRIALLVELYAKGALCGSTKLY